MGKKIENINIPLNYPKELLIILIVTVWAGEKENANIINMDFYEYSVKMSDQLVKFGYSTKEILMLYEMINILHGFDYCHNESDLSDWIERI